MSEPLRLPWHVGRTVGKTLYDGDGPDDMVGVMMTRELADGVVAAVNAMHVTPDAATIVALQAERDAHKLRADGYAKLCTAYRLGGGPQSNRLADSALTMIEKAEKRLAKLEKP